MGERLQQVQVALGKLQGRREATEQRIGKLRTVIETGDDRMDTQHQVVVLLQ